MRIEIILFVVLLSSHVNAQSIPSLPVSSGDSSRTRSNFIIIKGDEIRRFPSPNFMDAVNGLFPWVFSPALNQNDYLFVINGFIYPDVNSINLNDIEEVIFTRDNLYGYLFYFSRAGTFVITTKTPKEGKIKINFNSQYNANWNHDKYLTFPNWTAPKANDLDNKTGHYLDEHLSVSWGGKKLRIYFSASLNDQQLPRVNQNAIFSTLPGDTLKNGKVITNYGTQRLMLNMSYRFSKKIEAGITGDYSHHHYQNELNYDRNFTGSHSTSQSILRVPIKYCHAAAFINYNILKNLSNTLFAEYLFEKPVSDGNITSKYLSDNNPPIEFSGTSNTKSSNKKYNIRDRLLYKLIPNGKFKSDISFTFAYLRRNASIQNLTNNYQNGTYSSSSGYWLSFKEKLASLNPQYNFSYQRYISGYVGASYLFGKKTFKDVADKSKKGIYAGLEVNLTPFLKNNNAVTSLSLSTTYSDLAQNNANDYWLSLPYLSAGIDLSGTLTSNRASNDPFKIHLARNKIFIIALNAGLLNGRVHFIAGWDQSKSDEFYLLQIYTYPPSTFFVSGVETAQGLSFALAARVIDKHKSRWQSRLNLLFPKTKLDKAGTAAHATPYRSSMRGGWQNQIECNRFFMQVNATLDIGHVYYPNNNNYPWTTEKHNEATLNYVVVGYKVPLSASAKVKDLSVFVHARNLFASERLMELYEYDHYAGIGVNVGL